MISFRDACSPTNMAPQISAAEWRMPSSRSVFAELMTHVSPRTFQTCVTRYGGDYKTSRFTCWDQYLCMAFAQLTYRESLRDIEACLRAVQPRLYHMGIRARISRSTLADANETRDWRIYADVAQSLIRTARELYVNEPLAVDLADTVYALDATIIDLCLSVFPWARYRQHDGAVKLHTQMDLRGSIPTVVEITEGKRADVTFLDELLIEPGAFYIMDRGYVDFARLHRFTAEAAFFVTRTKKGMRFRRRLSRPIDFSTGLTLSDHTIGLVTTEARRDYPAPLRRVSYIDPETKKRLRFLTNNFTLPALTIARLYKSRWRVELLFESSTWCTPSNAMEYQGSCARDVRLRSAPDPQHARPTAHLRRPASRAAASVESTAALPWSRRRGCRQPRRRSALRARAVRRLDTRQSRGGCAARIHASPSRAVHEPCGADSC